MELIKFNDKCIISRAELDEKGAAKYDKYEKPILKEIYNGPCCFQQGGQTYRSIQARNDMLYLPTNKVLVESNDVIDVTTARGRKRHGIAANPRDIEMPISGAQYTRMEIQQSKGN